MEGSQYNLYVLPIVAFLYMIKHFFLFDIPPMDIENVFEDDLNGMYFNRISPKLIVAP